MSKFRLAYCAYPIDQMPPASMVWFYEFVEEVQRNLRQIDLVDVTFDPGDAFNINGRQVEIGPEVESINAFAQRVADLTVAFLPKGVPTIGVPMEIDRAARSGKTVVLFTDTKSWSLGTIEMRGNVKIFGLDDEGREAALVWLQERPQEADPATEEVLDPLPVRLLSPESRLPSRGYKDDAGLDLYVVGNYTIQPGDFYDVPCGVAVELPEYTWGFLTGRSSTLRSKSLLVHSGVIDAGYRGPLFAGVWNMGDTPVDVKNGERIAQLIVLPNLTMGMVPEKVESLSEHLRGSAGFGSTGV